jgi:disulfide bond formation protein DsbB
MMNQEMFDKISFKVLSIFVIVLCFGSVGLALISQYMFDMQPCAWCILQRIIFVLIGLLALGSLFINTKKPHICVWFGIELFTTLGIGAAIYQFKVASKSFECGISLAEKIINLSYLNEILPSVFGVMGLCGESSDVLGIPYVLLSLFIFMIISSFSSIALVKLFKQN